MAKYREQRNSDNVLIGYIRTVDNVNISMVAGNADYQNILIWLQSNTADIDTNALSLVKKKKIEEYKTEAIARISTYMPDWDDIERVKFIASIWNMLGSPNASQVSAKNIYLYVKDVAIPTINTMVTIAEVQAVDVAIDPNWP